MPFKRIEQYPKCPCTVSLPIHHVMKIIEKIREDTYEKRLLLSNRKTSVNGINTGILGYQYTKIAELDSHTNQKSFKETLNSFNTLWVLDDCMYPDDYCQIDYGL